MDAAGDGIRRNACLKKEVTPFVRALRQLPVFLAADRIDQKLPCRRSPVKIVGITGDISGQNRKDCFLPLLHPDQRFSHIFDKLCRFFPVFSVFPDQKLITESLFPSHAPKPD